MLKESGIESAALAEFLENNPNSLQWHEEAEKYMWDGVTHNGRRWDPTGVYIDRAEGAYKYDVDGHRYIDYWMGHGSLIFGHSHPVITQAAMTQLARGTHYGGNHAGEVRWAELICRLIPSAEKVRFFSSGTEATMMALRLARIATGRQKIIKFGLRFHGWHDYNAVDQTGQAPVGIPQAVAENVIVLPTELNAVDQALSAGHDVAGVIIEADGASWGAIPNPPGFLAELRRLTRERGVILIFDEIVSGFRYSPGGIQALEEVTPDLTCLAKIVAGGLPGGVIAGRADLLMPFSPKAGKNFLLHHGTFNANPLSSAAGIAALSMLADPDAPAKIYAPLARLGEKLRAGLNAALAEAGLQGRAVAYGRGSVFHLLFDLDGASGVEWPADGNIYTAEYQPVLAQPQVEARLKKAIPEPLRTQLRIELDNRGVQLMAGYGGFVSTAHTEADIEQTVSAFAAALAGLKREGKL
jgi:glutamate-1-semialdehyde 2,1-aminomutase